MKLRECRKIKEMNEVYIKNIHAQHHPSLADVSAPHRALRFYSAAPRAAIPLNDHTLPALLKACSHLRARSEGNQIHARALKSRFFPSPPLSRFYQP